MFEQDESMLRFGATSIENLFILDYLPAAKGDYVKVYLYGFFLSHHEQEGTSVASLAHELGLSEADVDSALRYWERRHLVLRLADQPPRYVFRSPLLLQLTGDTGLETDPEFVTFSEAVYALFSDTNRKIRPSEIALAWEWVQEMHMRPETVLMLLTYYKMNHGKSFSFQTAQSEAARMCESGVTTPEDAEDYFAHSRRVKEETRAVLRRLGKLRAPSQDELNLYSKWTNEWHYEHAAILDACQETIKGEPTFGYLDGILKGLRSRSEGATRNRQALKAQLQGEKETHAAVRAFAEALGIRGVSQALKNAYESLTQRYPAELVLLVAQQAHAADGDLATVEHTLETLARRDIRSYEAAKAYFEQMHDTNRALQPIFEAAGMSGRPTASDRTLYNKWLGLGFDQEMILLAAKFSQNAEKKMPYMDKILATWHEEGITTPAQAAEHKRTPAPGRTVSAQQYTQREYSEEELHAFEQNLLEEARKLHEQ